MRLADLREMSVLLNERRKWAEGVLLSSLANDRPLAEFLQLALPLCYSFVAWLRG
jgi:hypothetical protein